MKNLAAGAGRAKIAYPDEVWPLDGFVCENDPLFARVLWLDGQNDVVLATIDQTSLPDETIDEIRDILVRVTGVTAARVVVTVSHTFSAPHLLPRGSAGQDTAVQMELARAAVLAAVESAATKARERSSAAAVAAGWGTCDVNVNRDVPTSMGWALGINESGDSDKDVFVVRIDDEEGKPLAVLANYSVQPSVVNDSAVDDAHRRASGDLAGAAAHHVEATLGDGTVAFFLIGAAGDQAPASSTGQDPLEGQDDRPTGFTLAQMLGVTLGLEIVRVTSRLVSGQDDIIDITEDSLHVDGYEPQPRERIMPTRSHVYAVGPTRVLPYWILRIGPAVIVGVQPELSATTGQRIKNESPFPFTAVATMVNGGAKYLPDYGAFDRFTYEAQSSRYARGSAELLVDAIGASLRALT